MIISLLHFFPLTLRICGFFVFRMEVYSIFSICGENLKHCVFEFVQLMVYIFVWLFKQDYLTAASTRDTINTLLEQDPVLKLQTQISKAVEEERFEVCISMFPFPFSSASRRGISLLKRIKIAYVLSMNAVNIV